MYKKDLLWRTVKQAILFGPSLMLAYCIGLLIGLTTLNTSNKQTVEQVKSNTDTILTYPTHYVNGQVLLPDYTHADTLLVINAAKLNRLFNGTPPNEVKPDIHVIDILNKGCIRVHKKDIK